MPSRVCHSKVKRLRGKTTLQDIRSDFGMVAVALESKDEVECTPHTALEEQGFLIFGFERGEERWASMGDFLGLEIEEDESVKPGEYEKRCASQF